MKYRSPTPPSTLRGRRRVASYSVAHLRPRRPGPPDLPVERPRRSTRAARLPGAVRLLRQPDSFFPMPRAAPVAARHRHQRGRRPRPAGQLRPKSPRPGTGSPAPAHRLRPRSWLDARQFLLDSPRGRRVGRSRRAYAEPSFAPGRPLVEARRRPARRDPPRVRLRPGQHEDHDRAARGARRAQGRVPGLRPPHHRRPARASASPPAT